MPRLASPPTNAACTQPVLSDKNMDTLAFFNIALSLVAALFAILTCVIGWLGSKLYEKLEILQTSTQDIKDELHGRITHLEVRVARLEVLAE